MATVQGPDAVTGFDTGCRDTGEQSKKLSHRVQAAWAGLARRFEFSDVEAEGGNIRHACQGREYSPKAVGDCRGLITYKGNRCRILSEPLGTDRLTLG